MSGIFKSVKKLFSKVGKLVKKVLPVLVIAAGVYFGGSYLMASAGGASAQAAGSVATSFSKSAGVWKSFVGGLGSGGASASAAAFAESSFGAMQQGASVSSQVFAGTSAVKALGSGASLGDAIGIGINGGAAHSGQLMSAGADAAWTAGESAVNSAIQPSGVAMPVDDAFRSGSTGLSASQELMAAGGEMGGGPIMAGVVDAPPPPYGLQTGNEFANFPQQTPPGIITSGSAVGSPAPDIYGGPTVEGPAVDVAHAASAAPVAGGTPTGAGADGSPMGGGAPMGQTSWWQDYLKGRDRMTLAANADSNRLQQEYLGLLKSNMESNKQLQYISMGMNMLGGLMPTAAEKEAKRKLHFAEKPGTTGVTGETAKPRYS